MDAFDWYVAGQMAKMAAMITAFWLVAGALLWLAIRRMG
jgi:hypothetical protein